MQRSVGSPLTLCLIGIDGSGKTTLAQALTRRLRQDGLDIHYVYGGMQSYLMRPVKLVTGRVLLRRQNAFAAYDEYVDRKRTLSREHARAARGYVLVWWLDFALQTLARVSLPLARGRHLILDRYVYDAALSLRLNLGRVGEPPFQSIDAFFRVFPKPKLLFLVDVDERIALSRKTDTPALEYLIERRSLYRQIIDYYSGGVVDGIASRDSQVEFLRGQVLAALGRGAGGGS